MWHQCSRSRGVLAETRDVDTILIAALTEIGSGVVQEKEKAYLSAIIDKLNDLFAGDVTEQDKVIYATQVIMGKMLESDVLVQQAANNTKEQFANSPDLRPEVQNAIMEALDAHTSMSTQAINSEAVQAGIVDILLNHAGLWERLRERAAQQQRGG